MHQKVIDKIVFFVTEFQIGVYGPGRRARIIIEQFESYHKINKKISTEVLSNVQKCTNSNQIADNIISIDEAMKNGFGFKKGPFELLDYIGLDWYKNNLIKNL